MWEVETIKTDRVSAYKIAEKLPEPFRTRYLTYSNVRQYSIILLPTKVLTGPFLQSHRLYKVNNLYHKFPSSYSFCTMIDKFEVGTGERLIPTICI